MISKSNPAKTYMTSKLAVVMTVVLLGSCGGGGADNASRSTPSGSTPVATAPGAPTLTTVVAGNGQATLTFTPPSSDGGASITSYTANCVASGVTRSTSGAGSPITVTSLTNGMTYACSVTATNTAGTSIPSMPMNTTPVAPSTPSGTSTAAIACNLSTNVFNPAASVNAQSISTWSCSATQRNLTANGIPDHDVGSFPNAGNPNRISVQSIAASFPISPARTSTTGNPAMVVGHALNGIKFDPGTNGTCNDSGANCTLNGVVGNWRIEALGQSSFNFGVDFNNAHVQPTGEYHYHGIPEKLLEKLAKSNQPTLIGWAADGFPVYAKFGYTNPNDSTSGIKILVSSYRLKATPNAGRPAVSLYPMGTFAQDYEYVAGLGDLDECNGRTGVTPEFPAGIYHYVITANYPYIQRCLKGTTTAAGG